MAFRKRNKNKNQSSRSNEFYDEDDDLNSIPNNFFKKTLLFLLQILDIVMGALVILKPILSLVMAIMFITATISIIYQKFNETVLDILCPLPYLGSHLPICQNYIATIPDFTHFVNLQESLYDGILSQRNTNAISSLELKRVELATRDVQIMVKFSNLLSKELLEAKLSDYINRSKQLGRDIQSLQAQTKGVLDNLITYNTFTFKKLSEVESKKSSRQELRIVYEHAMMLVEKETKRLIISIDRAQSSLNDLEEDLYAIQEISIEEKFHQKSIKPHVIADLLNLVNGEGLKRPIVEENLDLLINFDQNRVKASSELMLMRDKMGAFQMDLEELRAQVITPVLVADSIPLEMHINNIGKAIERLKNGKVIRWEEQQTIDSPKATN